jgi:hypothetical protein
MLEVAILRVLFLQAINRRTPCSLWIPVSPKLSGRPSKATYHHGRPTSTHWAATGCASRTGTASRPSWPGSPAGCSWDVAARLCRAGETTLRARRTEWLASGVFDKLVEEAIDGYDRIIAPGPIRGRRRRPACTKAPCGGEGTGPNPTDRAKIGWKWSVATDLFADPHRLGHRRSEPQRLHPGRTHLASRRRPRTAVRR